MSKEWYSIKEAAQRLGISSLTLRRKIKAGKINAEFRMGPYGEQYYIPVDEIDTAAEIIPFVKFKQEHDVQDLALVLNQFLEEKNKPLVDTMVNLNQQVQDLTVALAKAQEDNNRKTDQILNLLQEKQEKTEKKSWWPWSK